jgi:hypothetical protein
VDVPWRATTTAKKLISRGSRSGVHGCRRTPRGWPSPRTTPVRRKSTWLQYADPAKRCGWSTEEGLPPDGGATAKNCSTWRRGRIDHGGRGQHEADVQSGHTHRAVCHTGSPRPGGRPVRCRTTCCPTDSTF